MSLKQTGRGNRGYPEIMHAILSVCAEGALKTHVMFECNLNSRQVQTYLTYLLDNGLIVKGWRDQSSKTTYRTTEKGKKYMLAYQEVAAILTEY